jgi:hypothetical protein
LKRFLLFAVAAECLLLVVGFSLHVAGALDRFERVPPLPVFRPPVHDARIGDLVRYQKRDRATGKVIGYLDYEVRLVVVTKGTTAGPDILLAIKETDAAGASRERTMHVQPRVPTDGFLPPRFEDDEDYPPGERPVVSRISTATFALREPPAPPRPPPPPVRGFLVEAVVPRRSLTEVAERYWISDRVPIFGVARWERGNEVLVLHHMDRQEPKG